MNSSWLYKPVIFVGKRIYLFFAAIVAVPVWLATDAYLNGLAVHDDEAAATGVCICFFAGIFTGRYLAEHWAFSQHFNARRLSIGLTVFIVVCLCWVFIHADFPIKGRMAINLLLYWLPFMAMSLAIGMLVKTVHTFTQKELSEARSLAEQSKSELQLLQSQLSPHFLFNTLNNIYGLSLTQHEKVPPLLLRLSDLLRYSVYEVNELLVALKEEISYINNYIEFEKVRLGHRLVLKSDMDASHSSHIKIAPMLLIVFIENAFKHAKNTADERIFIDISLKTWNDLILFSVKNSHKRQERPFDRNSGLGLDNVRKRLALLYQDEYRLDVEEDDHIYSVMLHLKQKK